MTDCCKKIATIILVFCMLVPVGASDAESSKDEVQKEISQRRSESNDIKKEMEVQREKREALLSEKESLANQIAILDANVDAKQLEIDDLQKEIEILEREIVMIEGEIDEKTSEIGKKREVLAEYIRTLYKKERVVPFEMLIKYDSFSEFLNERTYVENISEQTQLTLDDIKKAKEELEEKKKALEDSKKDLDDRSKQIIFERMQLENERTSKEILLAETANSEAKYQELLRRSEEDLQEIQNEISNLEESITKKKSSKDGKEGEEEEESLYADFAGGTGEFVWPVPPKYGISQTFDDRWCFNRNIRHNAIDVPIEEGTPIHASDDAVVVKVKIRDIGYNYIMLYHGDGLITIYGHALNATVEEGQKVSKGDIIGASGGRPRPGDFTTGFHLHFEVRKDGVPVDPMGYL